MTRHRSTTPTLSPTHRWGWPGLSDSEPLAVPVRALSACSAAPGLDASTPGRCATAALAARRRRGSQQTDEKSEQAFGIAQ